jgi:DnaJ-domain-containing protein 1
MPEQRPPIITLDELVKIAEARIGDLDRLGLGQLPDTLQQYGITDTSRISNLVQSLASHAYKQIAREVHPDRADSSSAEKRNVSSDAFQLISGAIRRINADPERAVRQTLLTGGEQGSGEADYSKVLSDLRQLESVTGNLRQMLVEALMDTPYSVLIGEGDSSQTTIKAIPHYLKNRDDGTGSFGDPAAILNAENEAEISSILDTTVDMGEPNLTLPLTFDGNEVRVGVIEVNADKKVPKAEVAAYKKRHESFLTKAEEEIREAFDQGMRIIGSVKIDSLQAELLDLSSRMETMHDRPELFRGESPSLIGSIAFEAGKSRWIDVMDGRIRVPDGDYSHRELVLGRRERDGSIKVGLFGGYTPHTKRAK